MTAKLAIQLEGPGHEEIAFSLTKPQGEGYWADYSRMKEEIEVRVRDYPLIPIDLLRKGVPVVGKSGGELFYWVPYLKTQNRGDIYIDNSLRCLPPKEGKTDAAYPTGDERKKAEACCRQYDRWDKFKPDVAVVSMHPAAILRDVTPLRLQAKNFEKAAVLVARGLRTLVLAGGKAVKLWLGYAENVTRWQGHFQFESDGVRKRRAERLAAWLSITPGKKSRAKRVPADPETKQRRARDRSAAKRAVNIEAATGVDGIVETVIRRTRRGKKVAGEESNREKMRKFALVEDPLIATHLIGRAQEEGMK